ncbi:MAG: hypothetical protein AB7P00_23345 [Sandaracinaceae bacterium]
MTTTMGYSWRVRAVSAGPDRVGLVWWEDYEVYFALVDATGTRLIADVLLGSNTMGAFDAEADVHWNGTEFGVAWNVAADEVAFQRIAADGTPIGSSVDVAAHWTTTLGFLLTGVRLSYAGAGVGWGVTTVDMLSLRVYYQHVPLSGPLPLPVPFGSAGAADFDIAGAPDGRFAIVYPGWIQKISAAGSLDGPAVSVSHERVLEHDGHTWVSMARRSTAIGGLSHTQLHLLRGESLSSQTLAFDTTATPYPGEVRLGVLGDEYAFAVLAPATSSSSEPSSIRLGRLRGPGTPTGGATLLVPAALIFAMDSANPYEAPAVAWSGSDSVITFWPDRRWGQEELYEIANTFPPCI